MKMLNHTFFACLLGMSLVSCSHAQQQKTKEFRLPDVPVTLTAPEDRAAYLSLHYCCLLYTSPSPRDRG